MDGRLTVCVSGCGQMGRIHAEGYREIPTPVDLVFHDPCEERAQDCSERFEGLGGYVDYAEALEKADAVDICTPHDLHLPLAKEAFARGKHVLVEKPTARTLEEADEMRTASERAGTKFMVCENLAFHPHVAGISRVLREGGIGKPFLIEIHGFGYWEGLAHGGWRAEYDRMGGGVLIDLGVHHAYLVRKWCPELESVFARMSHATFGLKGEDTAVVVAWDRSGLMATIHASWGAPGAPALPLAVVYGTKGTLTSDDDGLTLATSGGDVQKKRITLCESSVMSHWYKATKTAVRAFVDCVVHNGEPPVTSKMGRDALEFVLAAVKSTREGKVVALPLME